MAGLVLEECVWVTTFSINEFRQASPQPRWSGPTSDGQGTSAVQIGEIEGIVHDLAQAVAARNGLRLRFAVKSSGFGAGRQNIGP